MLRKKIGSNNYEHIREKHLSCLPGLTTLRNRIAHFHVNPGMLHSSLGLVKKHLEKETREEKRLVVISYDEVAVDKDISFDQRTETPLKSSSKLQVSISLFFSLHGYNHSSSRVLCKHRQPRQTDCLKFHSFTSLFCIQISDK